MTLHIFVEPSFKDSIWCRQQLKAICDEATAKRYNINIIKSDDLTDIDFNLIYKDSNERRLLLCLCTTFETADRLNNILVSYDIHVIFVNFETPDFIENYSNVIMDYSGIMHKILYYLSASGRDRIALYGINPNSSSDMIKSSTFSNYIRKFHPNYSDNDIYYNYASLNNCYTSFHAEKSRYNAVICANDIVALSLINNLKSSGVRVPEDFYIVSCGNSVLSEISSPSITNISVDLFELGRQAVHLYSYLNKRENKISVSVKLKSELQIRDSTDNFRKNTDSTPGALLSARTVPNADKLCAEDAAISADYMISNNVRANFYDDPCASEILRVEDLLCRLYEFDFSILNGLLHSVPLAQIIEKLHSSQQAISYRIKRMCQIAGVKNKGELISLVRPYIPSDALEKHGISHLSIF